MEIALNAKLETRRFKNGPLEVLVLKLSNNTEKIVFLTSAEKEILLLNNKVADYDDMPDLR